MYKFDLKLSKSYPTFKDSIDKFKLLSTPVNITSMSFSKKIKITKLAKEKVLMSLRGCLNERVDNLGTLTTITNVTTL